MKKLTFLLVVTGFLMLGCSPSSTSNPAPLSMTVNASISTSDKPDTPSVNDSTNSITLEFSETLNMDTVADGVKIYKVKSTGDLIEEPCNIIIDNNMPKNLVLNTGNGTNLTEGEEYKLWVSGSIKSNTGLSLADDFEGYFATGYSFALGTNGMTDLGTGRTAIVCISDIHLGDARSINSRYGWFKKNEAALVEFLNIIRRTPFVKELVIAGDMFDEWVAPMEVDTFNGGTQSGFVDSIAEANTAVIDSFNNIIQDGQIKVTYVPGNHDMLVTSSDIQRILPGISDARDVQGLGAYSPTGRPEIIIEHGHRYDFYNAPDPISNRSITKTDSILPPGFFVTKIAVTSGLEKISTVGEIEQISDNILDESQHYYFLYWSAWQVIMSQKPVKEEWNDKIIKTGIDGFTDTYAINDLIPYHAGGNGPLDVNLYKGIQDTWYDRQKANNVPVPIWAATAIGAGAINPVLDAQSAFQYFFNPASDKRIVVFGHTHKTLVRSFFNLKLQKTVYVNSGTWVDADPYPYPTMTFAVIIPQKTNGSTTEYIATYQYFHGGDIQRLAHDVITNLN